MAKKKAAKARPRKRATLRRAPKAKRGAAPSVAELQAQVNALTRQLNEAQEQQTATTEVLKVISSSPGELEPVFESLLVSADICATQSSASFFSAKEMGFAPWPCTARRPNTLRLDGAHHLFGPPLIPALAAY